MLKIRNCGQIVTWPVQNGSNFNFPSYEPLLLQDPAIHILPCSAHFTQLSPFYPAMPVLPFYVHFTLLYPFYPSMSNSPSYFHFTLLCPFYPAIFTLLCPFYPFMSLSASYAHFTLLCPFYPAMSILPCNVHFTLLCPFIPTMSIVPCYVQFTLQCPFIPTTCMSILPCYAHYLAMPISPCCVHMSCEARLQTIAGHSIRSNHIIYILVSTAKAWITKEKYTMSTCYACQFEGISLGFPPLGYCEIPHGYCDMAIAQM